MRWETFEDDDRLARSAAAILLAEIRSEPSTVLGLPTGRTPIPMYRRVVAECSREYRCFQQVTTFNLDEYVGVAHDHPGSYHTYMREHLFHHVDLDPARSHIPDGTAEDLDAECRRYEAAIRAAGGLRVTFLGLGRNGHIGFNEPGTAFDARTRIVELTESTRAANAEFFADGAVPTHALTMGIGTILESQRIVLLVSGSGKEEAVERLRDGDADPSFPASALRLHDDVLVLSSV